VQAAMPGKTPHLPLTLAQAVCQLTAVGLINSQDSGSLSDACAPNAGSS